MAHEQRPITPGGLLVKHAGSYHVHFPAATVLRLLFA